MTVYGQHFSGQVTGEFFRVANGFELVGGNDHFGRRGWANARHRSDPSEKFFQTIIALNEFRDLFVSYFEVSLDCFERCLIALGELFLESSIYKPVLFGDGLLELLTD